MKKTFTLFALIVFSSMSTSAQIVRVGLLGIGIGAGNSGGRLGFHVLDASYAPMPKVDYGGYVGIGVSISESKFSTGFRYGLQGKYYFMTEKFRPFVGLQAGLISGLFVDSDSETQVEKGSRFQVVPQARFRVGPLNIWVVLRTFYFRKSPGRKAGDFVSLFQRNLRQNRMMIGCK